MEGTQAIEALPELPTPGWADAMQLCSTIPGAGRVIWGEGYEDGRLMIILDNPGARERADGTAFVCGTRETLLAAVASAGIERSNLYVTYLLKCRPTRKYDRQSAWAAGIPVVQKQMEQLQPKVVIAMGNTVLQAFSGLASEVKLLRGQPWEWSGLPVVVTYHPLAVRRRPNLHKAFMADLQLAAWYLQAAPDTQQTTLQSPLSAALLQPAASFNAYASTWVTLQQPASTNRTASPALMD